jgi:hypothetical protein
MKKRIKIFVAISFAVFIFTGCGSNAGDLKSQKDTVSAGNIDLTKNAIRNIKPESEKTNFELLQGKWQSTDDKTNFLVFENNHRKEIAEGMDRWDDEVFALSDKCMNESDKDKNATSEKDKYIYCIGSDLCWYILELDSNTLSLSYMGRGNTLTYVKVK